MRHEERLFIPSNRVAIAVQAERHGTKIGPVFRLWNETRASEGKEKFMVIWDGNECLGDIIGLVVFIIIIAIIGNIASAL